MNLNNFYADQIKIQNMFVQLLILADKSFNELNYLFI